MPSNAKLISRTGTIALLAMIFGSLIAPHRASAQTESVLYSFCSLPNCADGSVPEAPPIRDAQGNLYGTTYTGGAHNSGTVYELARDGTFTVLYSFGASSTDGFQPMGGLVRDAQGNLYGTTVGGGAYLSGELFKISPQGIETILHSFGANSTDGLYPESSLVMDAKGNIYGTTPNGGKGFGSGTVFKLSTQGTYSVIYRFGGSPDGLGPSGPLFIDKGGNLYGTTGSGGAFGEGAVFKITPGKSEAVLHSFSATGAAKGDGVIPDGGVVMDAQGNLYGTTYQGGAFHSGVVFKVASDGSETVLHSFGATGDGGHTNSGLVLDAQGNLYGTTFQGGQFGGGIAFKLAPDGTETILHNFGSGSDGGFPHGGLLIDSAGNLYGVAEDDGAHNGGAVFEITP